MQPAATSNPQGPPARKLRHVSFHLLLLVIGALLPLLLFAAALSWLQIESGHEAVRRGALDRARAIMSAVDAELRGVIATMRTLTASKPLAANDLQAFHAEMQQVLAKNPQLLNITLSAAANRTQLLNASLPYGTPLGQAGDPESFERTVSSLEPVISGLGMGPFVKRYGVPVRVPLVRGGKAAYVLTGVVKPDAFLQVIQAQKLEAGWVSGLVDQNGAIVARVPQVPLGTRASQGFLAARAQAGEGWYRGPTVEGKDTYTAHVTSGLSGWSIGLAVPAASVLSPAYRAALLLGLAALFSLLLAVGFAFWMGRRLAVPVASLAAAARSLGGGAEVRVDAAGLLEVADVASALREADEAMRERERLLEREKALLQESDRAKDEFLAMLSHELRNPLAGLVNAAQVLKIAPAGHESAVAARQVIERQTAQMRRLVEDLLDVSSVTMGKTRLLRERLRLDEVAEAVARNWRVSGRLARHEFHLDASETWVEADRARLEQVATNLLDNAVKFTPEGKSIRIDVWREGSEAYLAVTDEGMGIPPDKLSSVFELFVQVDPGTDRGRGGMGIGLALVRRLAELHGGGVMAKSAGAGRGASFIVRLPAIERSAPAREAGHAETAQGKASVLVVEDNEDARRSLADLLRLGGHRVTEATDGAAAIATVGEARPDIVFVDIGLPGMDGHEVARRLRLLESASAMTLVALTGYGQEEDRRRAIASGFDLHLTKPVPPEQLELAIEASLEKRR